MRSPDEIIDELIRARATNNEHWGELIRLAWKAAPERAREISQKINAQDRVVVGLAEELARPPEKPKETAPTKKAVLLPGGGILHAWAVREALALGLTPIVTDRDPDCPCAKIPGVEFHQIDCYDVEGHLDEFDFEDPDWAGAFCGGADTHVVVAAVHEAMGWNGRWVSRKTAETCKDKTKAKSVLLAAGVATARFAVSGRAPCIYKPVSGTGSRLVRRHLTGMPDMWDDYTGFMEELLEGPEQSVEILMLPSFSYSPINVVDRHFVWMDDQPLEVGHTNPSRLDDDKLRQLYELCFRAAKAVGADVGFFKIDSILTKDGPKVLECTPRLSGGYDSQVSTPASSGRNLLRFGLQLACGLELDWKLLERKKDERVTIIHRPELASASSVSPVT